MRLQFTVNYVTEEEGRDPQTFEVLLREDVPPPGRPRPIAEGEIYQQGLVLGRLLGVFALPEFLYGLQTGYQQADYYRKIGTSLDRLQAMLRPDLEPHQILSPSSEMVETLERVRALWPQITGRPALYWNVVSHRDGTWAVMIKDEDATRAVVIDRETGEDLPEIVRRIAERHEGIQEDQNG